MKTVSDFRQLNHTIHHNAMTWLFHQLFRTQYYSRGQGYWNKWSFRCKHDWWCWRIVTKCLGEGSGCLFFEFCNSIFYKNINLDNSYFCSHKLPWYILNVSYKYNNHLNYYASKYFRRYSWHLDLVSSWRW